MRILITGASSFTGTNAIEEFVRAGNTILNYYLHLPLKAERVSPEVKQRRGLSVFL
jgi:nucleoside-diphosphate-sugar epimerase